MKLDKIKGLYGLLFFLVLLCSAFTTQAATVTWLGGTGSWADASGWDTGSVPTNLDVVIIPSGYVRIFSGTAIATRVEVQSSGRLNLHTNAHLVLVNAHNGAGIYNLGRVYINGELLIENITGYNYNHYGRGIYNSGTFTVYSTGTVEISNVISNSVENSATGYFKNYGAIALLDVTIHGIVNSNYFRNYGEIYVEADDVDPHYGIINHGDFRNSAAGEILIENGGAAALGNSLTSSILINYGSIEIQDSDRIGFRNSGTLYNYSGASIKIENSTSHSFYNNGTVNNHGYFLTRYGNSTGIFNIGVITNYSTMYCFYNDSYSLNAYTGSTFRNFGNYYSVSTATLDMHIRGEFINEDEGYATVNKKIYTTTNGLFTNNGIFVSYSQNGNHINSGGTMVNNGIIEDKYSSFPSYVMDNQQVIAKPLSGTLQVGVPYANALDLSSFSNSTVLSWKVSKNGASAGTYNSSTNEFTPNAAAAGLNTLYVLIQVNSSGNNRNCVVPIQGTIIPFTNDDEASTRSQDMNQTFHIESQHTVLAYPNPTIGLVSLESEYFTDVPISMQVFNILGQMVYQQNSFIGDKTQIINLPDRLMNGTYYMKCVHNGKVLDVQQVQLYR